MTSKKTKTFFITLLTLTMVVSLFFGSVSALAAKPDKANKGHQCEECHASCKCTDCSGSDCPTCDRYKCPCAHSEEEREQEDLKPNQSHIHGNGKGCGTCDECGGCLCDHSKTTCCWTQWKACKPCAGHDVTVPELIDNQDNNENKTENNTQSNNENKTENNTQNNNENKTENNTQNNSQSTYSYITGPFVPFVSGPAADVEEIEDELVPLAPNTGAESNATVFMACAMIAGIIACSTGIAAIKGSRKEA